MTTNKPRLVYFEAWVDPIAERILGGREDLELLRLRYSSPLDENQAEMARANGYQVQSRTELRDPWFGDAALLARCPDLLAVSSTGAGYDYIDVDACTSAGVIVCNQGGTNLEAVAEHALGFMLALSKRMSIADHALRRGGRVERFALQGNDIKGKTLGIIGIGAIGSRLAELCSGLFGMRVLAYDPYLTAAQISERRAAKVELADLLKSADFVSVNCPRTAETLNMLGTEQFALMKVTAYFINTARGGIHDEAALAAALRDRRIAGAGIDVFLKEPPPAEHPLLQFDNVIATPHTAGITEEALREMSAEAAQQWIAIFAGQVPPRLINPEVWLSYSRRFERVMGFAPASLD